MNTLVQLARSGRQLCAFLLAISLPALVQAQPTEGPHPVKALTTSPSGALLVLRDNGLFTVKDGTSTAIPLPPSQQQARPTVLAKGADGSLYAAGPGLGVWRYNNASTSWQSLNATLPGRGVTAMATHATQPGTLYAYLGKDGIFRSRDAGVKWVKVDSGPREPVQTFLHSDMPGSMESGWLFAGTTRGVARSMDCFCLWGDAGDLRGKVSAISYDPGAPENVYAVIKGQLHHSADGGETWTSIKTPQAITALDFSPSRGLVIGTASGSLFALGNGGNWRPVDE